MDTHRKRKNERKKVPEGCVPRTQKQTLWNCNKDGSRSPEVYLQGSASNQPVLLT